MDNLENEVPQSTPEPEFKDAPGQYESLASLIVSVLVLVVVLAGVFDLFLFREVKNTRADLANARAALTQIRGQGLAVNEFARKLAEYGRTNKDFIHVLMKYGLKPTAPGSATPGASAPASLPPAKQ
jgi:hypothetical protein